MAKNPRGLAPGPEEFNMPQRVALYLVTGFLGAGKTSFLQHLLRHHGERRIAIVENEFGDTPLDQELLKGGGEGVWELPGGCLCCSLNGELEAGLLQLMEDYPQAQAIFIEATGVAHPGPILEVLNGSAELKQRGKLQLVIGLVDLAHWRFNLEESPDRTLFADQLAFCDLILLNKSDAADQNQRQQAQAWVQKDYPLAQVLETQRGEVDLAHIWSPPPARVLPPRSPSFPFAEGLILAPRGAQVEWICRHLHGDLFVASEKLGPEEGLEESSLQERMVAKMAGKFRSFAGEGPLELGEHMRVAQEWEGRKMGLFASSRRLALFFSETVEHLKLAWQGSAPQILEQRLFKKSLAPKQGLQHFSWHREGSFDPSRLQLYLNLLNIQYGKNLYRLKGKIRLAGQERAVFIQGVMGGYHFELLPGPPPSLMELVVIGRNLNVPMIQLGLDHCRVEKSA